MVSRLDMAETAIEAMLKDGIKTRRELRTEAMELAGCSQPTFYRVWKKFKARMLAN